jgi:hypothetical protein
MPNLEGGRSTSFRDVNRQNMGPRGDVRVQWQSLFKHARCILGSKFLVADFDSTKRWHLIKTHVRLIGFTFSSVRNQCSVQLARVLDSTWVMTKAVLAHVSRIQA